MKGREFPAISARLLVGKAMDLPDNLRGRVALVRQEPGLVDAWVELFRLALGSGPIA